MLLEESYQRPEVGTLNIVGDTKDDGTQLYPADVTFGEFVDLSGKKHGPLTPRACFVILQVCSTEAEVLECIEHLRSMGEFDDA